MAIFRWIGVLALALVIVLLAIYNAETVTFNFFGLKQWEAPLILVLFVAFVLGIGIGIVFSFFQRFSHQRRNKKATKEAKESGLQNFDADSNLLDGEQKLSGGAAVSPTDPKFSEDAADHR